MLKEAEIAARALGVRLQVVEARAPTDFARAFSEMTRARAGALTVVASNMFLGERRRLVDLAAKNRLPAVYPLREFVDPGGLMAYGPDLADVFRRAATYVDKILKGAKPADLPVEQPTKFELVINLKTTKALGLAIPRTFLGGLTRDPGRPACRRSTVEREGPRIAPIRHTIPEGYAARASPSKAISRKLA